MTGGEVNSEFFRNVEDNPGKADNCTNKRGGKSENLRSSVSSAVDTTKFVRANPYSKWGFGMPPPFNEELNTNPQEERRGIRGRDSTYMRRRGEKKEKRPLIEKKKGKRKASYHLLAALRKEEGERWGEKGDKKMRRIIKSKTRWGGRVEEQ